MAKEKKPTQLEKAVQTVMNIHTATFKNKEQKPGDTTFYVLKDAVIVIYKDNTPELKIQIFPGQPINLGYISIEEE